MQVNAMTEEFEHIEIFGKPVLFTNARVDRATIPDGWYRYDIRGSDYDPGSFGTLEREVGANHAGTILSPEEIPLSKGKDYRPIRGSQNFLGEEMTLAEFCACHDLPIPENPQKYLVRPASPEEAGLFYAQTPEQDEALGAIGHVRIDFGHGGKEFWHTWHPRGAEELNSPEFKAELDEVVGQLRESVLQDLSSMHSYCYQHGGEIEGGICTQNYGYTVETERYRYLNPNGIAAMRSALTNEIFKDELYALYEEKDLSYKEVTEKAQQIMRELITQMESNLCDSPAIAQMMAELSKELESVTGKKVYGYLKKPLKEKVDAVVDELVKLQPVADCYSVWNELRDKLESYYKTKPREHLPLSQQKEFRAIKNMVIREAENIRLGVHTFEDEDMQDEPEENVPDGRASNAKRVYELAADYRKAKAVLTDNTLTREEKRSAVDTLERLWREGFTTAAHQLGKVWRDGLCDPPDEKQAEKWFRCAAEAGLNYSQYALGKLLQGQKRISEAVSWYEKATAQGNQYAHYRLGKLYLAGADIPKDVERAVEHLTASAKLGNQYAQYALGKLYLMGRDIPRDEEAAHKWLTASAEQGNRYAQFFLERIGQFRDPSILLAATRLLHHLANTFRDNAQPPANPAGLRIDSKRRRKLMQKRLAMGHKPDDHADPELKQ